MTSAVAWQAVYMNYISKQVQLAPGEWTDVELFLNVTYANNNTQFFYLIIYLNLISYEASSPLNSMGV